MPQAESIRIRVFAQTLNKSFLFSRLFSPIEHQDTRYPTTMATVDIPKQQKAAVKVGSGTDAKAPVQQVDVPTPGPGEVLVKINWQVDRPALLSSSF
jgi:hypothetical protein